MQRHKWYKEIIAWAEGKQIQSRLTPREGISPSEWVDDNKPVFHYDSIEFRVKPESEPLILYVNTVVIDGVELINTTHASISAAEIAAKPCEEATVLLTHNAMVMSRIAVKMVEVEDE